MIDGADPRNGVPGAVFSERDRRRAKGKCRESGSTFKAI
jgi:hypothetical protein